MYVFHIYIYIYIYIHIQKYSAQTWRTNSTRIQLFQHTHNKFPNQRNTNLHTSNDSKKTRCEVSDIWSLVPNSKFRETGTRSKIWSQMFSPPWAHLVGKSFPSRVSAGFVVPYPPRCHITPKYAVVPSTSYSEHSFYSLLHFRTPQGTEDTTWTLTVPGTKQV